MHIIALVFAALLGIGSIYWFGPDNPLEELAEEIIEEEVGIDLDLTPGTKETGKK